MAPHPDKLDREVYVVAAVVVIGVVMSILDTTIVNVALETLSRELDAPLDTIQWVSTGYLLALATVIPLTGWASERFGAEAGVDDRRSRCSASASRCAGWRGRPSR